MLEYGLVNHVGITILTGEIGAGKTTLIRKLLDLIEVDVTVGLISNTHQSFGNLLQWVATAFDLPAKTDSKAVLYDRFGQFLIQEYSEGRRTLLIIDEAQNLSAMTLEEMRLLTNINADKHQILQLMLVGQPELRETLNRPDLRQFVQRIGVDFHLAPLSSSEADEYIKHRLGVAGGDEDMFSAVARRYIYLQCGGVPRLINSMCDTALVYGYAEEASRISAELVHDMVLERAESGLYGAGLMDHSDETVSIEARIESMNTMLETAKHDVKREEEESKPISAANT